MCKVFNELCNIIIIHLPIFFNVQHPKSQDNVQIGIHNISIYLQYKL